MVVALVLASFARPADAQTDASAAAGSVAEGGSAAVGNTLGRAAAGPRLLVSFRSDASASARADAIASVGGRIDAELTALGVTRIVIEGTSADAYADAPAAAAILARHGAVVFAEHDSSVRIAFEPNDTYYRNDPYVSLGQWGIRAALIDKAWDVVRGSPAVTVAVLDTGVDAAHPDLVGALLSGTTYVSQPSSECVPETTRDDNGHGTHVSGIVGANGNDGRGVAGVAFGVRVLPVKALDCTGVGSLSDVAQAITWAVDRGARIVNLSLGSPFDSATLRSAIAFASSRNVLVVAAVGNCGGTLERCTSLNQIDYPAAYEEVVAVGATDTDDSLAAFSTRNATVGVVAPGRRIVSTTPTYPVYLSQRQSNPVTLMHGVVSGTSQAAPFVAGLAALIWSQEPALSAPQVAQRLRSTADDLGAPGRDDSFGAGRINALRAVTSTADVYAATYDTGSVPTSVETARPVSATVRVTNRSSFAWKAAGAGAVRLEWSWLDSAGAPVPNAKGTTPLPVDVERTASASVVATMTAPAVAGSYSLRFDLLRDGVGTFSSRGTQPAIVPVRVGSGVGASYAPAAGAQSFELSATTTLTVSVTNTGTRPWPAGGPNPVRLSYHWVKDGAVAVWDGLRGALPADVPAGGTAKVSLPVMPPATAGTYVLRLDLVQEGVSWFGGLGVAPHDLAASVRAAYVASYTVGASTVLLPGGRTVIAVTVKNDGTVPWTAGGSDPVRLATHVSDARGSTVIWDGQRTSFASDVAPGASVTTNAVVDAPLVAGSYRVRVDVVREGIAWFSSLGVPTGDADLLVAADFRARLPGGTLTVSRASPVVEIAVTNTGIATWTPGWLAPLALAAHWFDAGGAVLVWDGPRTPVRAPVAPNETMTLAVQLGTPPPGAALLTIDLVADGFRWFGSGPLRVVTLVP